VPEFGTSPSESSDVWSPSLDFGNQTLVTFIGIWLTQISTKLAEIWSYWAKFWQNWLESGHCQRIPASIARILSVSEGISSPVVFHRW
jgi:hypothetical protein